MSRKKNTNIPSCSLLYLELKETTRNLRHQLPHNIVCISTCNNCNSMVCPSLKSSKNQMQIFISINQALIHFVALGCGQFVATWLIIDTSSSYKITSNQDVGSIWFQNKKEIWDFCRIICWCDKMYRKWSLYFQIINNEKESMEYSIELFDHFASCVFSISHSIWLVEKKPLWKGDMIKSYVNITDRHMYNVNLSCTSHKQQYSYPYIISYQKIAVMIITM